MNCFVFFHYIFSLFFTVLVVHPHYDHTVTTVLTHYSPMAWYSLFVLKVPLHTNQPTYPFFVDIGGRLVVVAQSLFQSHATDIVIEESYSFTSVLYVWLSRLVKNNDEANGRISKQAVEAKLPYMLKFLAHTDDDVSANVAPFAHDYVTLLKQISSLSDCQKEFVKVRITEW